MRPVVPTKLSTILLSLTMSSLRVTASRPTVSGTQNVRTRLALALQLGFFPPSAWVLLRHSPTYGARANLRHLIICFCLPTGRRNDVRLYLVSHGRATGM